MSVGKEYVVFFKAERTNGNYVYFKVDNPAKTDKIVWMWAAPTSKAHQSMARASAEGKKIRVWAGNPHTGAFGKELIARVYNCEIETQ